MITRFLQETFNHLLATDPYSRQRLAEYAGKSVGFDLVGSALNLLVKINSQGISVESGPLESADCVLRGSPVALARYLNEKNVNPSTNVSLGVEIEGDLEFARRVSKIVRNLEIDWTEIFSGITGDFAAHHFGRVVSSLATGLGKARVSARKNINYILSERLDHVVHQDEVEVFYREVDQLAADTEKLEQRINALTGASHG